MVFLEFWAFYQHFFLDFLDNDQEQPQFHFSHFHFNIFILLTIYRFCFIFLELHVGIHDEVQSSSVLALACNCLLRLLILLMPHLARILANLLFMISLNSRFYQCFLKIIRIFFCSSMLIFLSCKSSVNIDFIWYIMFQHES